MGELDAAGMGGNGRKLGGNGGNGRKLDGNGGNGQEWAGMGRNGGNGQEWGGMGRNGTEWWERYEDAFCCHYSVQYQTNGLGNLLGNGPK